MRILIEPPTWLGDAVMATPAIENLANFQNEVEITLIGSFASIEVLKNHQKVIKTVVLDKNYPSLVKISRELGSFDTFVSFRNSFRAKFLKLLISANNKHQFTKSKFTNRHQVEKYNDFVNDILGTNFPASKLELQAINSTFSTHNLKLGINPGASYGSAKRWYPDEFAQVAAELSEKYDIVIFGGLGEVDIANDIEKLLIEKGVTSYQNLAGKTTIPDLINQISSLDLFITGDSGPMHIAAAFKIPTVSIFGPTNHYETSQWMNKNSMIVKKNFECQPCMKRICPLKHHNCMKMVLASDVLRAVKNFN
ncbi:glycosyltransferase family 9 protein [Candidatus Pseudothioglobus singularis]|nr:glycosyltransferase family 9 protein [Candidatus Pseudothioglobus singularis]